MRKIKFRIWNTELKDWRSLSIKGNSVVKTNPSDKIMQFTGLKDKNGKEIYEGDIVKITHCSRKEAKMWEFELNYYYGIVKFGEFNDDGECSWGYGFYYEDFYLDKQNKKFSGESNTTILTKYKVEVIGNIYENPELIKNRLER